MKLLVLAFLFFPLCSCTENNSAKSSKKDKALHKTKSDLALRGLKGKIKSLIENDYKFIEQSGTIQKKLTNKTISIFNENGNQLTVTFYNEHETLNNTEKYEYNEIGQKKEMKKFDADNTLQRETFYYYSLQGNDSENINYTSTGSFENKVIYKYDNGNNRIEEDYYFPDEKSNNKVINKYDDSCNLIEVICYDVNGIMGSRFELQFEDMCNIIGTKYYNAGVLVDEETKFEDLDEAKNWRKETIFYKGRPVRCIERKIEYY